MKIEVVWIGIVILITSVILVFTINAYYKMEFGRGFLDSSESYIRIDVDGKKIYVNWDRILSLPSPYNYSQRFKPNSVIIEDPCKEDNWRTIKYHINSKGFRDKEYNYTKPNGTYRIVLLGDSYVFGANVQDNETFDYFFEKEANKYRKIESLNLGVWGYDTQMEVKRLKDLGLKFHPDMVMLFYFQNDFQSTIVNDKMDYYFTRALMKKNYSEEEAGKILTDIIENDYDSTPLGSFSEGFKRIAGGLAELYNLSKEYNFSVVLFAFPSPEEHIRRLRNVAMKYNWTFINLKDIGYTYKKPWVVSKYDEHPSVYAHKKIAEFLIKFLRKKGII